MRGKQLLGSAAACFLAYVFFSLLPLLSSPAEAQLLINPQSHSGENRFQLSPVLSFTGTDYKVHDKGNLTVDRSIFGLAGAYGLSRVMDAYGEIGWVFRSKLENAGDDNGIILGGGVRGFIWGQDRFSVFGNAGVRYINESYGDQVDGSIFEVPLGLTGKVQLTPEWDVYGGLDVYPYSDGQIDFPNNSAHTRRELNAGLRVGGDFKLDRLITFNGEVALITDQGFTFRITLPY